MLLSHLFAGYFTIGIVALALFILIIGIWFAEIYAGCVTLTNFLIGCFIVISLSIVCVGTLIYLMVFSTITVWVFFLALPISCYFMSTHFHVRRIQQRNADFKITFRDSLLGLGISRKSLLEMMALIVTIIVGFLVALVGRTGNAISHISQTVPFIFWPIVGFSFFLVYLIFKEDKLSVGLKLCSMFAAAFLVFGAPLFVYNNYVTEDSFGLLGVVRSIIQTGEYGWVPHLGRTGFYAIIAIPTVVSSSEAIIQVIYKIIPPLLASIYIPLFIYLLLEKIIGKKQMFPALASIFLFPLLILLSIPQDKTIAAVFFMGVFWFSFVLINDIVPRKANVLVLCISLIAIPFLHDYFGLFSIIPLIFSLFLRLSKFNNSKHLIFSISFMILLVSLLIPSSFVFESYVSQAKVPTIFSIPSLTEIGNFWTPMSNLPIDYSLNNFPYIFSDNFMWVRLLIVISGLLFLNKSTLLINRPKTKTWLVATVLAFWVGYFLLKVFTQNPPEEAKDYRFGLFVDLSLIPLAGLVIKESFERLSNIKIQIKLKSKWIVLPRFSSKFVQTSLAIVLISIITVSVYSGFNFDRIMQRPIEAQGIGRYVVTNENLDTMRYVQSQAKDQKCVVLTDSHMGQVAQGTLDMNFEKAELFNLNGGGALYSYFNKMRRDPTIEIMNELMNKTNSQIGFFVIGLNDWRGWQPTGVYWIDSHVLSKLKEMAWEWRAFGENDTFVFVFKN